MKIVFSVGVAAVLLLVGCAQPNAVIEAAPTLTPTPSPTPTEEPWPQGKPRLSEFVLSPDGMGPIRMGEPVPAGEGDLAVALLDSTYCDSMHPDSGHGGWEPNYPLTPVNGNYAFFVETAEANPDSPVVSIHPGAEEIRTADGLGRGSTIAEVNAVYGDAIVTIPLEMAVAHVVQGTHGQLIFWGLEVVDGMEVIPLGVEPVYYYTLRCH